MIGGCVASDRILDTEFGLNQCVYERGPRRDRRFENVETGVACVDGAAQYVAPIANQSAACPGRFRTRVWGPVSDRIIE